MVLCLLSVLFYSQDEVIIHVKGTEKSLMIVKTESYKSWFYCFLFITLSAGGGECEERDRRSRPHGPVQASRQATEEDRVLLQGCSG